MAKRIRRDLSDPNIKRIIRQQTTGNGGRNFSKQPKKDGGNKTFLIWLVVIITAGAATLYFLTDGFKNLGLPADNSEAQPTITIPPPTIEPAPAKSENQTVETDEPELKPVARRIQVEILNGCGVDGLAKRLTRYLRQHDIDVVSSGNYRHFEVPASRVVDRVNNADRVEPIARLLGITSNKIVVEENINLQLDATIVLGLDYKSLTPFKE